MRTILATLGITGILVGFCSAQESGTPSTTNATRSDIATPAVPKSSQAAADATLDRRVIEANAQFELLNQLAQEHRKRAEETPRDPGRYQWESALAKELDDRAAAILSLLNNASQERLAAEPAQPELAASGLTNSATKTTLGPSPEEIAFLEALAARRAAVQQEIATASEAANLYAVQLATNTGFVDFSNINFLNIHFLIRDNGNAIKQLQKELFDLELKHLEFRALCRRK